MAKSAAKSEVAQMFETLPSMFVKGSVKTPRTFYFSLDDVEKWTVVISADKCEVKAGKTEDADCFFELFALGRSVFPSSPLLCVQRR